MTLWAIIKTSYELQFTASLAITTDRQAMFNPALNGGSDAMAGWSLRTRWHSQPSESRSGRAIEKWAYTSCLLYRNSSTGFGLEDGLVFRNER